MNPGDSINIPGIDAIELARFRQRIQKKVANQQRSISTATPRFGTLQERTETGKIRFTTADGGEGEGTPLFEGSWQRGEVRPLVYRPDGSVLIQGRSARPIRPPRFDDDEEIEGTYLVKVLFYDLGDRGIYIGGDRDTPTLVFTLPAGAVVEHGKIDAVGPGEDDWIVSLQYANDDSRYYYPAKKVLKVLHGREDLGEDWEMPVGGNAGNEKAMATRPIGHGRFISYTKFDESDYGGYSERGPNWQQPGLPLTGTYPFQWPYGGSRYQNLYYYSVTQGPGGVYADHWDYPNASNEYPPENINPPPNPVNQRYPDGIVRLYWTTPIDTQDLSIRVLNYGFEGWSYAGVTNFGYSRISWHSVQLFSNNLYVAEILAIGTPIGIQNAVSESVAYTQGPAVTTSYFHTNNIPPGPSEGVPGPINPNDFMRDLPKYQPVPNKLITIGDDYNIVSGFDLSEIGWHHKTGGKYALKFDESPDSYGPSSNQRSAVNLTLATPSYLTGEVTWQLSNPSVDVSGTTRSFLIKDAQVLPSDSGGSISGSADWGNNTSDITGSGTIVIDENTSKSWELTISGNPTNPTVSGTNYGTVAIALDGSSVFMKDDLGAGTYPDRANYYYCKDGVETEITDLKAKDALKKITDPGKFFYSLTNDGLLFALPKQVSSPTKDLELNWPDNDLADILIIDCTNNTTDTVSADYLPVSGTVLSASYYPEE